MRRTAALLLSATALAWAAPAYAAAGDPLTGYWARTRTGLPVPVQPPEPVPEGGTWVSGDPVGPVAVSALRTDLADGLVAVELRLTVAEAVGIPAVQACPSTERWAPEQGGRLEAAPEADCTAPLDAKVDGDVLVVPLPPGLDVVNVVLRPAPGSTFSLTMERATAASVVTAPQSSSGDFTPVAPAPAPPPFDNGTAEPPAFESTVEPAPFAPPAAGLASEPLLAAPVLPESVAPAPAAAGPAPQTAPFQVAAPVAAPRPAVPADERSAGLLAAAVLAALGAQAVRLARQPVTAPRALGGSARRSRPESVPGPQSQSQPQVVVPGRGVGRFRTPTTLTAPPVPSRGVGRFRTARPRPPVRI